MKKTCLRLPIFSALRKEHWPFSLNPIWAAGQNHLAQTTPSLSFLLLKTPNLPETSWSWQSHLWNLLNLMIFQQNPTKIHQNQPVIHPKTHGKILRKTQPPTPSSTSDSRFLGITSADQTSSEPSGSRPLHLMGRLKGSGRCGVYWWLMCDIWNVHGRWMWIIICMFIYIYIFICVLIGSHLDDQTLGERFVWGWGLSNYPFLEWDNDMPIYRDPIQVSAVNLNSGTLLFPTKKVGSSGCWSPLNLWNMTFLNDFNLFR